MTKQVQKHSGAEEESRMLVKRDCAPADSPRPAIAKAFQRAWKPVPVPPPEVDPQLTALPLIQRSAEVLRYKILQLEYAVSPEGALRGWFKLNVLLFLLIGIPAVLFVPVITLILGSLAVWTDFLANAVMNILRALVGLLAIGAIITVVGFLFTRSNHKR
jgi:hypothetical protein